jgi:hypothetical protein
MKVGCAAPSETHEEARRRGRLRDPDLGSIRKNRGDEQLQPASKVREPGWPLGAATGPDVANQPSGVQGGFGDDVLGLRHRVRS